MRIRWRHRLLGLLIAGCCLSWRPVLAQLPFHPSSPPDAAIAQVAPDSAAPKPEALEQQSQALYETGRFAEAAVLLQQAVQAEPDPLRRAVILSNLALVYQQLGTWDKANESSRLSFAALDRVADSNERQQVLAQALNIRGRLQLAQGQPEPALSSWEQATAAYQQGGNAEGVLQTRLNQAQALQALGLYRRATTLLTELSQQPQPALSRASVLRSLGDSLQVSGDLTQSRQVLEQALQQVLESTAADAQETLAAIQLSLANLIQLEATAQLSQSGLSPANVALLLRDTSTSRTLAETALKQRQSAAAQQFLQQIRAALQLYRTAASQAVQGSTRTQAQLSQLNALIELQDWAAARALAADLQLNPTFDQTGIYQQINLALSLSKLEQANPAEHDSLTAAQLLATAAQHADQLQDRRAQSFALGSLGNLYEQTQQWEAATRLTRQALVLSQSINAADISYRWQWQLGRLLKQQNQRDAAIAAYSEAVKSLQSLRQDLVTINREIQFSFQEQVEPVYRELVNLLLSVDKAAGPAQLVQARQIIEGLQIAELDNFFREACLETQFQIDRVIDQANLAAAVLYTIALPDRLEVILKLPQRELIHYSTSVEQAAVDAAVDELLAEIKRPYVSQRLQVLSQQVYDWLIRPAEAHLTTAKVETLVFVLDSSLRNLPVAALSDGQQFLIEKYSLALAPGLQLTNPKPLQHRRFNVLLAGLSEARANFSALNFVAQEIEGIQAEVPSKVLFNQSFTEENLQQQLDESTFSIVHIATHGQFSSNVAETFILAWDRPIDINTLSDLLQAEELNSPDPIELLVLSACRTAVGDRRAALGMAGVAVRAGARSTIASLWNLDDDSGAVLMDQFYQALTQNPISKAEALRRAQRALLDNPQYAAPRFWAPYILLGNWL